MVIGEPRRRRDSRLVSGGKFWRITPVINRYLSPNMRLEAEYG